MKTCVAVYEEGPSDVGGGETLRGSKCLPPSEGKWRNLGGGQHENMWLYVRKVCLI